MFGLSIYEISIILTLVLTSLAQFYLVITGRSSDASKLESQKDKCLNKLYSTANKQRARLDKTVKKISELSEIKNLENNKNGNNGKE